MSDKIHGFKPIFAADSRLLILGSFPSVKSRKADFYYGNPQNRFWKMLCAFFGEKAESTEEKRALLLSRGIALWDAVASCEITGSADASIRNYEAADIPALLARTRIQNIFCNGRRAYEVLSAAYPSLPVPVRLLPSTSPANPRFDARVWEAALAAALGESSRRPEIL